MMLLKPLLFLAFFCALGCATSVVSKDFSDLFLQAGKGNLQRLQQAKKDGADLHRKVGPGVSLLMVSARRGQLASVDFFLKENLDPNSSDDDDQSSLHYALGSGSRPVQMRLLESGADASLMDRFGVVPLIVWAETDEWPLVTKSLSEAPLAYLTFVQQELWDKANLARRQDILVLLDERMKSGK